MSKAIKKLMLISLSLLILAILTLILCYIFIWKSPSTQEIYKDSQKSVVELKSQTGDDIISYGSAVFIDNNGTLVSNAHIVTYKHSGIYKEYESFEIRLSFET